MRASKKGRFAVQTIRVREKTGNEGSLHLDIPLGKPNSEFEVVVLVQPTEAALQAGSAEEQGWPAGYFENTFGSIADETFGRPPQGELPKPLE
jgi:hypothetical protein